MKFTPTIWRRLRSLAQRRGVKRDIDKELRFHIEQRTDEYIAGGMSPEEAARSARRRFGNVQSVREECREAHGANFGETILQDVRFGLRMLGKHPGFTILAVLSLAIGIGVNTTIFSALDAMLIRPLNVKEPDSLVRFEFPLFTIDEYQEMQSNAHSLSNLVAMSHHMALLRGNEGTTMFTADYVTANYFAAMEVKPALGTLFSEADKRAGNESVVVLSYGLWQRRFGGDPKIVGQTIPLWPQPVTVLGVAEKGFGGLNRFPPCDFWFPLKGSAEGNLKSIRGLELLGRLGAGYTVPQVQAEVETLMAHLGWDLPKVQSGKRVNVISQKKKDAGNDVIALLAMSVVGLVLLVACANVSSLLLARYEERRRELALRVALGGGRLRLLRQLLIEGLLLSTLGAAAGLLLTFWGVRIILWAIPSAFAAFAPELHVDGRVLGVAMGLACVATFVFALLPAWRATRVDLSPLLKGEFAPPSGRIRWWTGRNVLVVGQLAISLVFLTTTTLLLRGFFNGMGTDFGFDPKNVLVIMFAPSGRAGGARLDQMEEHVRALPGVRAVSLATRVPFALSGGGAMAKVLPPQPGAEVSDIAYSSVEPAYFDTLGIRLLRGRFFEPQDNGAAPRVVIVSEAAAKRYWPGEDPLGKTLQAGIFGKLATRQIVGVVRDVDNLEVRQTPAPFLYFPFRQESGGDMHLIVRTDTHLVGMAEAVRRAMREVDKDVIVMETSTMMSTVHVALLPQWIGAWLGGVLGALAFLLAVCGLYGVVAHAVSRRTRELGIRMALGARRADVLRMVLRQGLVLALVGVALGLPVALAAGFLMRRGLFGISPADPLALMGSSVLVTVVALLASVGPARRAARINPMEALRYE